MKTFSWIFGILRYTDCRLGFASRKGFYLVRSFNRGYAPVNGEEGGSFFPQQDLLTFKMYLR